MTSTDLLYSDPLAAASEAAKEIALRTGVESHDVALVMGSGWVTAADALGTPKYECDARFSGSDGRAVSDGSAIKWHSFQ